MRSFHRALNVEIVPDSEDSNNDEQLSQALKVEPVPDSVEAHKDEEQLSQTLNVEKVADEWPVCSSACPQSGLCLMITSFWV